MDRILQSGNLQKFSMGRSTGIRAKNWKLRFIKLTFSTFTICDNSDSNPKFEIPVSAMSIVFESPSKAIHPEAGSPNFFCIRLFDNGVYTLALLAENQEEKQAWLAALKQATEKVKGVQWITAS